MKVLDIGCGWGGLALYLHRHYGVDVLGVALAPDQIAFCSERAEAAGVADRVKFELMDYRDVEGQFDRITSVGLIEHLGTPHYPGFFAHTHRLLKDDGVMFSHCCGRMGVPGVTDKWTRKYIFPGGYIPALSELVTEAEKSRLIVIDVEAMRYHYAHTLEEWYYRTMRAPRGDHRALRRALLPDVAILSGRRRGRVPLWRPGQLAASICEAPRRHPDDPGLSCTRKEARLRALEEPPGMASQPRRGMSVRAAARARGF